MVWWDSVLKRIEVGDIFYTPGRGMEGGNKKKPFSVISKETSKITLHSGEKSKIPLLKGCFDVIEEAFKSKKYLWLRVASAHGEPFPNSADELIRQATKSDLARGNYVCALLEHCGLVKYSMMGNKKIIELP